jgi:transcriptional regulator with XRE-family HTH domain
MAAVKANTERRRAPQARRAATQPRKNHIDELVAARIKSRRLLAGMSQTELATKIGVTFQALQKYETGENRVSAGRLWRIADVLGADIAYFFQDSPRTGAVAPEKPAALPAGLPPDTLQTRETLALLRAYYGVSNPAARRDVIDLLKSLGAAIRSAKSE